MQLIVEMCIRDRDKYVEGLVEDINLIFDSKQKIVAEKNKNEEELRASISNMSHDLRTPLTSIMEMCIRDSY